MEEWHSVWPVKVCIVSQYVRRSIGSVEVGWRIGSVEAHKGVGGGRREPIMRNKILGVFDATKRRKRHGRRVGCNDKAMTTLWKALVSLGPSKTF